MIVSCRYQHVHSPTRYRLGETPNVLDLVFSNEEGMIRNMEYLPGLAKSDHVVLRFIVACYVDMHAPNCPRIIQTNYDCLNDFLRSCNWEEISAMNVEEAYKYTVFKSQITKGMEEC